MTNAAAGLALAPAAPPAPVKTARTKKIAGKPKRFTREDFEIVAALEAVKSDMEFLHNCFDHTTDAILVDSLVYELKAANLKYQYYLNLCKEKGIVGSAIRR